MTHINPLYQSQLIFSLSKLKEPCSHHSPCHSPALHFLQAVTLGKKAPQNEIRKSCVPLMWLNVLYSHLIQSRAAARPSCLCSAMRSSTAWWGSEVTSQDGTSGYFRASAGKVHFWLTLQPDSPPWQGLGLVPANML